eukprot:11169809-Lingulodinium_polyedra.AAC.1
MRPDHLRQILLKQRRLGRDNELARLAAQDIRQPRCTGNRAAHCLVLDSHAEARASDAHRPRGH